MKRWLIFILFILLSITPVSAKNNFNLTSITDKCHIVSRNTTVIPIEVLIINDGNISSAIPKYKLGMIENISDYDYEITKFESSSVSNIYIDTLRDNDNLSNVYYEVPNDISVKKNDILMTFNIRIEFNDEYPSTLQILNNEIVLGDKKTCEIINGYKTEVSNREVNKYIEDNVDYFLFILISIIVLISSIILLISIILRRKIK